MGKSIITQIYIGAVRRLRKNGLKPWLKQRLGGASRPVRALFVCAMEDVPGGLPTAVRWE